MKPMLALGFAVLLLMLQACGEGNSDQDTAGVGSGGTGTGAASGTVTGFGSVIIDGVRWQDATSRVETEVDPRAAPIAAAVRLGQRVDVQYQTVGYADALIVEPEVIGKISAINLAADSLEFTAAGQTVQINTSAGTGPATVFDGFEAATELRIGDLVEVHGALRRSAKSGHNTVAAGRVQRIAALPAGYVRVSGIVEALGTSEQTLRVGGLTINTASATVQPAGSTLANGQRITVWGRTMASSSTLSADVVRVRGGDVRADSAIHLSGYIGRFDSVTGSFELGGIRFDARNAAVTPAGAVLADNAYVLVAGTQQSNGTVAAQTVEVRTATLLGLYVDISGEVSDYKAVNNFTVRGQRIDATGVSVLANCPNNRIDDDSYVNVVGVIKGLIVEAVQLQCSDRGADAVVELSGIVSQVSIPNMSFKLTPKGKPARDVFWGPTTRFEKISPEMLNGKDVELIGRNDAARAGLLAVHIKPH